MFLRKVRRFHLVGIGGIGMSGIAEVLLNLGFEVSGSDLRRSDIIVRLEAQGGRIFMGHSADHVRQADVVVISSAVSPQNPEIRAARERKIPVIPRAEMLAELMRMKVGVAIAGSHGKTTTASMIAHVLAQSGLDPTVVIGGKVNSIGSNAKLGRGEVLVAEADESDGTFLKLSPTLAVITNVDPEHLEHYGSMDELTRAFIKFANKVPFYGAAVLCVDCLNIKAFLPQVTRRCSTYGVNGGSDYSLQNVVQRGLETAFDITKDGLCLGRLRLAMPGRHNALNCLAALAVATEFDIPFDAFREAVECFGGIQRRFTVRGEARGVMVVDDYGHHPSEIRATLAGAKEGFDKRVIAVFQPHRYTRVRDLLDDFIRAFDLADLVLVMEIYPAGEEPLLGISGTVLFEGIRDRAPGRVTFAPTHAEALVSLLNLVREGDMVITLGAGDVWKVGQDLVDHLIGQGQGSSQAN